MILGIVGHAAEKFTKATERAAKEAMLEAARRLGATAISSGRSPMGGVDLWAEALAEYLRIPTRIFPSGSNQWGGPGGFKERNLQIADVSDIVLVVVVRELPPDYHGMTFKGCYHCKGRNPPHVKSGGCWTAWQAKAREWAIVG
jgi:hypothetical protein